MKLFLVISGLVAVGVCVPLKSKVDDVVAKVIAQRLMPALEHEEVHDAFGQFALRYVTAEGTVVSERGRLVPTKDEDYVLITEGEISYVGDDGDIYTTKFTAGIDGYKVIETNHPLKSPEPVELPAENRH